MHSGKNDLDVIRIIDVVDSIMKDVTNRCIRIDIVPDFIFTSIRNSNIATEVEPTPVSIKFRLQSADGCPKSHPQILISGSLFSFLGCREGQIGQPEAVS